MAEVQCDYCGMMTPKTSWQIRAAQVNGTHLYCSRQCRGKAGGHWNRKIPTVLRCPHCDQDFEVPPCDANRRKYCSRKCHDEARRLVAGSDHWNWKGKARKICEVCERPFEVFAYRAKNARFCSRSCSSTWLQTVMPTVSSTEWVVVDELDRRGLVYKHSSKLGKFVPDFIVGEVVIEVDGDYWHNLPGMFERDAMKDAYYQDRGYRVIRIWEHEVNAGDFSKLDAIVV
jgi:very-short-patch-repair endonuclease